MRTLNLMVIAFLLGGCASKMPMREYNLPTPAVAAQTPLSSQIAVNSDEQGIFNAEPIQESDMFVLHDDWGNHYETWPVYWFKSISFNEQGVFDTLRLISKKLNVPLQIKGGMTVSSFKSGSINVYNASGSTKQIIDTISNATGMFIRLNNNVLEAYPNKQFVLDMPPAVMEDTYSGMANTISTLGATNIDLDRVNKTLTFRANSQSEKQIQQYLKYIKDNRSLLTYDVHIYQVDLTDSQERGINWDSLSNMTSAQAGLKGSIGTTMGSVTGVSTTQAGINTALSIGNFSLKTLVNFLNTQGTVRSVSQPRLSFISGSKGQFRTGTTREYVSKVGNNTSTGTSITTTETSKVKVGIDLSVAGNYHDGNIYTRLNLSVSDLIQFTKYTAVGTELQLPTTGEKIIETELRSRPGDTLILAGNTETKQDYIESGAPVNSDNVIVTSKTKKDSQSVLVVVMRPRVILFTKSKKVEMDPFLGNSELKPVQKGIFKDKPADLTILPQPLKVEETIVEPVKNQIKPVEETVTPIKEEKEAETPKKETVTPIKEEKEAETPKKELIPAVISKEEKPVEIVTIIKTENIEPIVAKENSKTESKIDESTFEKALTPEGK